MSGVPHRFVNSTPPINDTDLDAEKFNQNFDSLSDGSAINDKAISEKHIDEETVGIKYFIDAFIVSTDLQSSPDSLGLSTGDIAAIQDGTSNCGNLYKIIDLSRLFFKSFDEENIDDWFTSSDPLNSSEVALSVINHTLSLTGRNGKIGKNYEGSIYRNLQMDLDEYDELKITVDFSSKNFYVRISSSSFSGGDIELISSGTPGEYTFNIKTITGLSGNISFRLEIGIIDPLESPIYGQSLRISLVEFTSTINRWSLYKEAKAGISVQISGTNDSFIFDIDPPSSWLLLPKINDSVVSDKKTWSSEQIKAYIDQYGYPYIPENKDNKSPDNTLGGASPSDILYPTQKAAKDYIDAGLSGKQDLLSFTPEDVNNKDTDNTLGGLTPSDTKYSTQKAVKEYVDTELSGKQDSIGYTPANDNDVFHPSIEGEIDLLDEKPSPVDDDLILIEDSEDEFKKKKIKKSTLGGAGGLTGAENLGSSGEGIFAQVSGTNLQFKRLYAGPGISFIPDAEKIQISAQTGFQADYVVSSVAELDTALNAIATSGIGASICLKKGTYNKGSKFVIPPVNNIRIFSEGGAVIQRPNIDSHPCIEINNSSGFENLTIEGIRFNGVLSATSKALIQTANNSNGILNVMINRCYFSNNHGAIAGVLSYWKITNNYFDYLMQGKVIYDILGQIDDLVISDNIGDLWTAGMYNTYFFYSNPGANVFFSMFDNLIRMYRCYNMVYIGNKTSGQYPVDVRNNTFFVQLLEGSYVVQIDSGSPKNHSITGNTMFKYTPILPSEFCNVADNPALGNYVENRILVGV